MSTALDDAAPARDVLTRQGRVVRLRAARPDDADELLRLHAEVGDDALRLRFFSANRQAAATYVRHLVRADDVLCLVAETAGRVVAVASAEHLDATTAEVAFLVADDLHGHGLGSLLLEHLADVARERGVRTFVADVLAENTLMQRVFTDAGFAVRRTTEDGVGHLVVDLGLSGAALDAADAREEEAERTSLRPLLHPRSLALLGVRRDGSGVGAAVLRSVLGGGFEGPVHVVHPAGTLPGIDGAGPVDVVSRCADLPPGTDLAVVAVPAPAVPGAVAELARAGVGAAVVVSSGFGELGEQGAALQAELARVARAGSVRVVGPNCLGVLSCSPDSVLNATFSSVVPVPGRVAVASQSGGVGIVLLDEATRLRLGIGQFVSLGNKADVSGNDLLAAWHDDPEVSVGCLYLESFGNAHKFARLARRFCRDKPLLAVVGGRSAGGRRAGASHTAAAATDAAVVEAVLAHGGVVRCDGAADMAATALLLDEQPLPAGRRLGVVTNAGGMGVLAADAAAEAGLEVPSLSTATVARLGRTLAASAGSANPVDTGAGATPEQLVEAVGAVAASGEVDAVLVVLVATSTLDVDAVLVGLGALPTSCPAVLVVLGDAEAGTDLAHGFTVLPGYEAAVTALARAAGRREWLDRVAPAATPDLGRAAAARGLARGWLEAGGQAAGTWVGTAAAQELLATYGLTVRGEVVRGAAAAEAAAHRQGLPVAVKVASLGQVHKSVQGLVAVGLSSGAAVRRTVAAWQHRLGGPVEVLVQPMATGVEVVVGLVREPGVGPLVLVGAGGVEEDVWRDRAFLLGPVTREDVRRAVAGLRVTTLLDGHRGAPPADLDALVDVVVAVGRLGEEVPEVAELDLNPVLVGATGCALVDVRLRVAPARAFADAPALGGR